VRLMSTIWAGSGGLHDDFGTAADVDAWLDETGLDRAGTRATAGELGQARALRDAVRLLAAHLTGDSREPADRDGPAGVARALHQVNAAAAALPAPCLELRAGRFSRGTASTGTPVATGLARVAEQAIDLLSGPGAGQLRACYAPGCVLYFMASHPRRAWCSVACGNRARAARHYQRAREHRAGQ
jgi:predicted RNA-binding Zn ribbon-like protein